MPKTPQLAALTRPLATVILLLALAACTPRLLAPYDEVTDRSVSALQRQTEAHLIALEAAALCFAGDGEAGQARQQEVAHAGPKELAAIERGGKLHETFLG